MTEYRIPLGGVGPGSQAQEEDGAELSFMSMPSEMATYSMPDVAESISTLQQANEILKQVQDLLDNFHVGDQIGVINLLTLDEKNLELVDQVLGEGEVSIVLASPFNICIQESVLAGVWRVQYLAADGSIEKDTIEVADIPVAVRQSSFAADTIQDHVRGDEIPPGVNNAIPLLSEINDKIPEVASATEPHVINLTLLPQSEEDLAFLTERLDKGYVTILSRGYGNCRVSSTLTNNVWWVQYFNSQDAIILNTLEVTAVPIVVCASQEDIEDSAQRLQEIREVYA
jgi:hydrogenase-1 operon protein HyaF